MSDISVEPVPVAEPITPPVGDPALGKTPEETFDAAYVRKLREEAATHRREKQEIAGRLKSFEDAQLTEQERLAKSAQEAGARAEAAEGALRRERAASAVRDEATDLKLNSKLAARLLVAEAWEYDDAGRPKGVRERLRELVKEFPELTGSAAAAAVAANHGRAGVLTIDPKNPPRLTDPALWDPK